MMLLLGLLACVRPCDASSPGVLCTVAGTGTNGYNGQGLAAEATWLFYPSALAFDGERPVIADFNNFLVRRLEADGTLATVAGSNWHSYAVAGDALASPLENPVDVAVDGETVYVAELHAGRVLRVEDGQLAVLAGTTDIGFGGDGGPADLAVFSELSGLAARDGVVFIADTQNDRIRRVADGVVDTVLEGLSRPERLHLDGDWLYVADTGAHAVRRYHLGTGALETVAGTGEPGYDGDGGPPTEARLASPVGVWADGDVVFVADTGNHAVRRVEAGVIETVVGGNGPGYGGDQRPAEEGWLDGPADVAVGAGALWIADQRNGVVRRVALDHGS